MPGARGFALLRSQGLGIACGLATVLLLAVGSFVLAWTANGASAGIQLDELTGFFERPALVHLWLYLLLPVMGLYGLNVLLATWHDVATRWRAGVRRISAYAPTLMHLSFLFALLAHLVGGLLGEERGRFVVSRGWQELPDGTSVRLRDLRSEHLPSGALREVRARLEVRQGGSSTETVVGYNAPLFARQGREVYLFAGQGHELEARLSVGDDTCRVAPGGSCLLSDHLVELVDARPAISGSHSPVLWVRVHDPRRRRPSDEGWIVEGTELDLGDGHALRVVGLEAREAIALRARHAPGNPLALAACFLLVLGVGLMWRRLVPRAPQPIKHR